MRIKFEEYPFWHVMFGRSLLEGTLTTLLLTLVILGLLYRFQLWPLY